MRFIINYNNIMKKIVSLFSLFLVLSLSAIAQSTMSDKQVYDYIVKQYEQGFSQQDIISELLKKGVNMSQLQRVRSKYEKEYKNMSEVKAGDTNKRSKRGRVANGETAEPFNYYDGVGTKDYYGGYRQNDPTRVRDHNPNLFDFDPEDYDDDPSKPKIQKHLVPELHKDMLPESEYEKEKRIKALTEEEDDEFIIFGHDIFRNEDLSFEPNMNIATPEDYVLGPGDNVFIDIYGASQQTIEAEISPDGYITIEEFGPIALSGLTVKKATSKLKTELGARFESSNIRLSVGQTRTIKVNVMGEVEIPGTYTLSAFSSVFHALYMAGGVSDIGTLREVKVFRNNRLITSVDIYDYILNGQLSGNIQLHDDDVIIVGSYDCLVCVKGKVKRPMYYEMKKDEDVAKLINYAGGFTGDAYTKSIRVLRKTGQDLSVYNVDKESMSKFTLADLDIVNVDSVIHRYNNAVEIKGAVFRPGLYQVGEKIRTVKDLVEYAEGVTENAFLAHAVLHRMKLDRTLEVLQINLEGIMNGTAQDVYLQNEDVLLVPTEEELKKSQTLTIHGEVFYPGIYKYASNQTIEDLILQAGGLKESASTIKVDVARRIIDPKASKDSEIRATTYSFEIRDGFIVDADPVFTLQPYDEVYVRRSPGFSEQENVEITGEVLFAGRYTLSKQNFRLSDLIAAAGGPSSMANVVGARLERMVTSEEKLRMQQAMKMAMQRDNMKDTTNIRNIEVSDSYFVGIDLEKALNNPGGNEDIVLQEGDRVIVPRLVNTVKINGEVMYPNTVGYISGKNASYYISQAGGYGVNAKRSRGYIIYQNGKVAKLRSRAKPAPGCEIVIPAKKQKNNMNTATQWITISTSVATVAALLINALK